MDRDRFIRGVIELSQVDIDPSLSLTRLKNSKLKLHLSSNEIFLDIRNSTKNIVELLERNSISLDLLKKLINNYTRN